MPFRDIYRNWLLFTGFGSANLLIPHEILIPESGPGEGESVRSFWMIEDTKSPGNWLLFNRFWRLSLQPDVKWALIQPGERPECVPSSANRRRSGSEAAGRPPGLSSPIRTGNNKPKHQTDNLWPNVQETENHRRSNRCCSLRETTN